MAAAELLARIHAEHWHTRPTRVPIKQLLTGLYTALPDQPTLQTRGCNMSLQRCNVSLNCCAELRVYRMGKA